MNTQKRRKIHRLLFQFNQVNWKYCLKT